MNKNINENFMGQNTNNNKEENKNENEVFLNFKKDKKKYINFCFCLFGIY